MAQILGTVTRAVAGSALNVQGPEVSKPASAYIARAQDNTVVGRFATAAEAQKAIERGTGAGRLRWAREDLRGDIEHYVGRDNTLDPRDIWGSDLLIWYEADAGVRVVDPASGAVDRWGDRSGNRNNATQATPGNRPTLLAQSLNGRDALNFAGGVSDFLDSALTIGGANPFVLLAVVDYGGAAAEARAVQGVAANFGLGVDAAAGRWEYDNGASITGAVAIGAGRTLLSVQQLTTGAIFRVNQAQAGTNAVIAAADTVRIGSQALATHWNGRIALVVVAGGVADLPRLQATERYAQSRYNTPTP